MTPGLTNRAAPVPAAVLTTPPTRPAQSPNPANPQPANPSPKSPCLFGSLRWISRNQRKVQSKELIDTTATTGRGPNPLPRQTPRPRGAAPQLAGRQPEDRTLPVPPPTRDPLVSTTYRCRPCSVSSRPPSPAGRGVRLEETARHSLTPPPRNRTTPR